MPRRWTTSTSSRAICVTGSVRGTSNRGDTIGVLELFLTQITPGALEQVEEAAHAPAYVVTDRRA